MLIMEVSSLINGFKYRRPSLLSDFYKTLYDLYLLKISLLYMWGKFNDIKVLFMLQDKCQTDLNVELYFIKMIRLF